jgi:YidC/Oxa1 family membrane protein insertase
MNFSLVTSFFSSILFQLYTLSGNLGVALISFTVLTRAVLVPLTLPSLKAQKKMREVQPELNKLKQKHKGNSKALQQAQMELYKKYNINPLNGCLPQLLQIVILIVLYHALTSFLHQTNIEGIAINPSFLWLDLSKPDQFFVLPVLAGVTQLILSLMILPATEIPDLVPNNSKLKKVKEANEKEEDFAEMAMSMQQQMVFIMPVMIGFLALRYPSGLGLYWTATTVFSIVQQYFLSGPGGLVTYSQRAVAWFKNIRGERSL